MLPPVQPVDWHRMDLVPIILMVEMVEMATLVLVQIMAAVVDLLPALAHPELTGLIKMVVIPLQPVVELEEMVNIHQMVQVHLVEHLVAVAVAL
jgi:hypothetical protein